MKPEGYLVWIAGELVLGGLILYGYMDKMVQLLIPSAGQGQILVTGTAISIGMLLVAELIFPDDEEIIPNSTTAGGLNASG